MVERLLCDDGERVVVRAAALAGGRIVLGAEASRAEVATRGVERLRFALSLDDDLRPFYERFHSDPLIGGALCADPAFRVHRRPEPFEALAWAITEQLIEYRRAAAIQRRIVARFGQRCPRTGLRAPPTAATMAALAPAQLEACDLSAGRALTLLRAARAVAAGRIDLHAAEHERGWQRLRAIRGIGAWTVEKLGLTGQGRYDQLPAGDLHYLELVGRLRAGGRRVYAVEAEVRACFAPYAPWAGLAGAYLLAAPRSGPART